jgi:hypothetical protein
MIKHTPGPWKINECGEIEATGTIIGNVYGIDDYPCLDDDQIDDAGKECLANGVLISSAPDLLDALKRSMDVFEYMTSEEFEHGADKPIRDLVRKAIAKAEGKEGE